MNNAKTPCGCQEGKSSADRDPFADHLMTEIDAPADFSVSGEDAFRELDQVQLDDDVQAARDLDDVIAESDADEGDDGSDGLATLTALMARHPGLRITLSTRD